MHILIVTQYFWPENFRINDLAKGLFERGHQVTVLTGVPNYPGGRIFEGYGLIKRLKECYDKMSVIRCPLVPRGRSTHWRLALNFLSFALSASLLGPLRCRGPFDVILVYQVSPVTIGLPGIVMKRFTGAPILFWILDLWPETISATKSVRSPLILKCIEKLVRFIYRRCDRILIQSRAFLSSIEQMGVPAEKIFYFPSWAEDLYQPVQPDGRSKGKPIFPQGFRVMFAGNMGMAQDFGTVLSAAEFLKDQLEIHWVIVGDGRMFQWVQEQVYTRGLSKQVHLLGRYPVEAMPEFFAQADMMLVTLQQNFVFSLTIPGKVQSYMACGRPILAALDGEGARIIEESGAGRVCPAGNPKALAEAVLEMARIPKSDREEMGKRALAYYRLHFERELLLERLEGWMKDLVKTSNSSKITELNKQNAADRAGML